MRQNRSIIYAPSCRKRKRARWRKREKNFLWFVSAIKTETREISNPDLNFNSASISIQIQIILGCAEFDKPDLCDTRVICVIQWRRESSCINVYVKVCADTCERTHLQNNIWWSDRSGLFTVWRLALIVEIERIVNFRHFAIRISHFLPVGAVNPSQLLLLFLSPL